ncbi:arylesterase [Acetobacteraceae bacterium KSS8]|uniref:Arylesterase n=1 Tax=Endosaccharibacter trunci TaxID=2812733 RepID=A0ABT1W5J0_9PROT|nr:arylesterase [Acetobacteraceae bacterium KSS8]
MNAAYGERAQRTKGRRGVLRILSVVAASWFATGRRSALADTEPKIVRILALGDSLTAGFGLPHAEGFVAKLQAALDKAGARAVVLDAGVSGDTSADGLARLEWALGDHPDAAIVELGANDGLRGLPPDGMERNLTAILDRLAAKHLPVLLAGMYAPPNLGQSYFGSFRAVFERLSRRPGLLFYPFFLDGVAGNHALNQGDGIHPNPRGVDIIVAGILPDVLKLVAEARRAG